MTDAAAIRETEKAAEASEQVEARRHVKSVGIPDYIRRCVGVGAYK
jgi:hypothetical protein